MTNIFFSKLMPAKKEEMENFFAVLPFSIPFLIGIYIFFNPFPHMTAIKEFCFYISLLALITLIIFKKENFSLRSPLTWPFVLFFLWGVCGLFFALDVINSVHDLWGHFFKYVAIYYLLVNYFNSQKKLEILSWIVITSATIFSLWAIIVFYFIDQNPFSSRLGVTFLEIHTDYIGFILIFALTLTLHKLLHTEPAITKFLLLIISLILCATTLLTQSRGALVEFFIAIVILSFLNKKILIFMILAILLIIMIPGFEERIDTKQIFKNERVKINALTMEIIKSYPLTGIGFGMQIYGNEQVVDLKKFESRLPEKYRGVVGVVPFGSPHNTILDIAVRTGIIGLALFFSILLTTIWMLWKAWQSAKNEYFRSWIICIGAAFLSFMAGALFADTAFDSRAVVFYTILAMITILWKITGQSKVVNSSC